MSNHRKEPIPSITALRTARDAIDKVLENLEHGTGDLSALIYPAQIAINRTLTTTEILRRSLSTFTVIEALAEQPIIALPLSTRARKALQRLSDFVEPDYSRKPPHQVSEEEWAYMRARGPIRACADLRRFGHSDLGLIPGCGEDTRREIDVVLMGKQYLVPQFRERKVRFRAERREGRQS